MISHPPNNFKWNSPKFDQDRTMQGSALILCLALKSNKSGILGRPTAVLYSPTHLLVSLLSRFSGSQIPPSALLPECELTVNFTA